MQSLKLAMTALAALALIACTGEAGRDPVLAADGGTFEPKGDDPGGSGTCSADGVPTACDPMSGDGCSNGACYLVKDKGPACVCPAGSAALGDACSTTTDCAAGAVCAGTAPPGSCRRVCDPDSDDCPAGTFCRFITAFPAHGYCEAD